MLLAPTYEAIKREISGKPMFRGKTADSWALDKSVRMVYYHQLSVILRVWRCKYFDNKGIPFRYSLCVAFVLCFRSAATVWFLMSFLLLLQTSSLHASTLVLLSFGMYIQFLLWTLIVHSYFWDSPWNLIVFVADGTITLWCILYTNSGVVLFLLFAFTFVPRLVLWWGTTLESLVLFFFCFLHSCFSPG